MAKVIIHISLGGILACLISCTTTAGDIHATIKMASNVEAVAAPASLERPAGFPPIALIWEATAKTKPAVIATKPRSNNVRGQSLHPDSPAMPSPLAYLSSNAQRFVSAAENIARSIFKGETTDPAIAESLLEQLRTDDDLEELGPQWTPVLKKAVAFAEFHQPISGPLRRLRKAFSQARFDEDYGIYREIDVAGCREAADQIQETLKDESQQLQITPVGNQPIKHFRTLCEQSLMVELSERVFPETRGSPKLKRSVKKRYESDYPEAVVRKIRLISPWKVVKKTRTMKAILGIERKDTYPDHPCTMETLMILQQKERNKWGLPQFTNSVEILPIDCDQLR